MDKFVSEIHETLNDGKIFLIDKPYQWTSFDVISKIKSVLKYKFDIKKIKIGHAGTLDPLATGLLIVCTGKKTKSINELQSMDKEYTGTFFIGKTTPSFDLETEVDKEYRTEHIENKDILNAAKKLTGNIEQIPPLYSAKKIDGKRAYLYARKGKEKTLNPSNITIHQFDIIKEDMPYIDFFVKCSKGTYIRSLARDFGHLLKSGAYLYNLRRLKIGEYNVNDAIDINSIEEIINSLTENPK